MSETVLTNARLVLPDQVISGRMHLDQGLITGIDEGPSANGINLEGDYLIPGLIDLHTDNLERHFQPRDGVLWDPVYALIAHDAQIIGSGITTVFDSLSIGVRQSELRAGMIGPMCEALCSNTRQGMLKADHRLHLRCEVTHPHIVPMLEGFLDNELLAFMSLMDHAPGDRQSPDVERWRKKMLPVFHFDEAALDRHQEELIQNSKTLAPHHRRRLGDIAREKAIPLASHDDASNAHVEEAADLSVVLTEFPTTFEAAEAARRHHLDILMGSPNLIRGSSHSGNIAAQDLARCDQLDILASDYIPASLLPAAFKLAGAPFDMPLDQAINTVTRAPARAAGLDDRGEIALGKRADLLRIRMVDERPLIRAVWRGGERVA